jgi:acetylornithine aminotransferase
MLSRSTATLRTAQRSFSTSTRILAQAKANTDYLNPTHLDDSVPPDVAAKLAKHATVTLNTYARPSYILTRGKGCKLWDSQDREFLDFSGGIAVNALGHADEGVAKVLQDQSRKLVHNSNLWHNEWSGELAYLLVSKTKEFGGLGYPKDSAEANGKAEDGGLKVFFTNSGTESNEGALKFVRKYGKYVSALKNAKGGEKGVTAPTDEKIEIVSFRDGFHGRSLGALSATWQDKYQAPFAPLVPGFVPATLNDIEGINAAITEKTCGVIVEPIQVCPRFPFLSSFLFLFFFSMYSLSIRCRVRVVFSRRLRTSSALFASVATRSVLFSSSTRSRFVLLSSPLFPPDLRRLTFSLSHAVRSRSYRLPLGPRLLPRRLPPRHRYDG